MSSSHFMSCRAIIGELKWRLKKKLRRRISGKDFELLNERSPHHLSGAVRVSPATPFVDLDVEIDISWEDSATYRYSKLYFARYPEDYFSESQVICFRMKQNRCRQRIRLKLPDSAVKPGKIRFRFDPLPYSKGQACVYGCVLVPANDSDVQSCETAHIHALKQATRAAVVRSEEAQLSALPHYPESMSLELQPGCNFR